MGGECFLKMARARGGNKDGERFIKRLLAMTNEKLGEALSYFVAEVRNEAGEEYRTNTL